jgi:hypothetical protein
MSKCDMADDCLEPVTMIGDKGYVYCTQHGRERRYWRYEHTRRMVPWELKLVNRGIPLPSYIRGPKPVTQ